MVALKNRKLIIILGAITAFVIVFSQVFLYQGASFRKEEVKTEKQDKDNTDKQGKQGKQDKQTDPQEAFFSIPSNSVLSSFHFEFTAKIILLQALFFEAPASQKNFADEIPISLGKYFHTLFHIIISPNAP